MFAFGAYNVFPVTYSPLEISFVSLQLHSHAVDFVGNAKSISDLTQIKITSEFIMIIVACLSHHLLLGLYDIICRCSIFYVRGI